MRLNTDLTSNRLAIRIMTAVTVCVLRFTFRKTDVSDETLVKDVRHIDETDICYPFLTGRKK